MWRRFVSHKASLPDEDCMLWDNVVPILVSYV